MTSPHTLLNAWQLKPRKRSGQNFLADPKTAERIVSRGRLDSNDVVLEIGAGLGALTVPLARAVAKVYAVEKDRRIAGLLKTELLFHDLSNVDVLEQDFFAIDLPQLADAHDRPLLVFGNLPYNISSQILVRLIDNRQSFSRAVLMFQKELAQRLRAVPGKKDYGRITAMLQYCAEVCSIADVKATQFYPQPRIDSEVLEITFTPATAYPAHNPQLLFQIIKAAFGKRRKTLKNALAGGGLGIDASAAAAVLNRAGIDANRRAETLSPSEFVRLTRAWDIAGPATEAGAGTASTGVDRTGPE
jgi:16S rRNA (adenine1518-N6/adenine1519-N6)-dimethyltransferase